MKSEDPEDKAKSEPSDDDSVKTEEQEDMKLVKQVNLAAMQAAVLKGYMVLA